MNIKVLPSKTRGTIFLSGNKNSALPVIAASMLWPGKVELFNIPDIVDVRLFLEFLESIGVIVKYDALKEHLTLDYSNLNSKKEIKIEHPGKLSKIRAVILLLAALAVRFKKVKFGSSFSGCNLGSRPLTVHFENLKKLGFDVLYSIDKIEISAKRLSEQKDIFIWQGEASVTATEVALIVAVVRNGKTTIYNAATEPHVQDTACFLKKMGVKINGIGTNLLKIDVKGARIENKKNKSLKYAIFSDHHEYATWLGLSAITGGNVKVVHNLEPGSLDIIDRVFGKFGYEIKTKPFDFESYRRNKSQSHSFEVGVKPHSKKSIVTLYEPEQDKKIFGPILLAEQNKPKYPLLYVSSIRKKRNFTPTEPASGYITIKPAPWPGLPVDVLSLFVPLAAYSRVPVLFHNWMYDGGLFWTLELRKANVSVLLLDPHRVVVKRGGYRAEAIFEAPYIIRATIALLMYGLSLPKGATILNADAAFRGHPHFLEKLKAIGVKVEAV